MREEEQPVETWLIYAVLAAVCAAMVSIFGKWGMSGIDADLATGVRSVVQAAFVVGFAVLVGAAGKVHSLTARPMLAIVLSGVAGGLSWIFAFRALQLADVSRVGPIDKLSMPIAVVLAFFLLRERPSTVNWMGIALIVVGVYLTALPRPQ